MMNKKQKKRPAGPLSAKLKRARKKIRFLKVKLFLLVTLPVAIIAIGNTVIREYVKIRVRQSAQKVKMDLMERHPEDMDGNKKEHAAR